MYKKVVSSIILIIMLLQLLANSCFAVVVESNEQINSISQNEVENALSESSTNTENGKENINDIGEIKQDDNVSKIEENEQDKNTNVTVNDNEKNQNTEEKEETKQEENKKIDIEDQYITEDDLLYSNKYLVKNGVVSRIDPNTTIEEFKKQVQIAKGNELTFYKKDGVTPLEGKILGTGMIVKGTNGQNYTLSVKGDVTGEGEANQVELTMMIRHAIELQGWELKNLDLTSADINGNGTVDIVDIDKMIKHIVFGKWEYDNTVTPNPPTIEVIGTEGSEEDLYTSEIEIKIKEDKSTKNSKTTYKISGAKEKEETSIEENETIKINEDGEYLITAYTYGVQGNRSKASNRKITVKKVETPKPEIYNINYELNGGENNSENPLTYTYGEEVELKDATKDCYTFKGWYKEQELTNKVSKIEKTQKGDITVYAKWEANKYNINYELNGGKNNSENPITYTYGEEVELKDATRVGYTFKGWYKEQELTNEVSKIEKTQKGDITVYAKWLKNEYKLIVHHYAKGTTNKLAEDEIFVGEEIGQEYQTKSLIPTLDEQGNIIETDGREYLNPSKYYVDGIEGNEQGTYIDGTIEVTYYYSVKSFKITGEAGEGGKIENADETVKYGENSTKQIIITPDQNKKVKNVTVNGRALINYEEDEETLVVTLPIFENVTEDKKIEATFEDLVMVAEIVSAPEGYESLIGTRYTTLKKAIKAVPETNNNFTIIKMLDNTLEGTNNVKNKYIVLDLNGYEVKSATTSIIVESGSFTVKNSVEKQGRILGVNESGIEVQSKGTFTLGENDEVVNKENIIIQGKDYGINTKGIFNFYDGKIIGNKAIEGNVNDTPIRYETNITTGENNQIGTLEIMEEAEALVLEKTFKKLEEAIEYANTKVGQDGSQVEILLLKNIQKENTVSIDNKKNILLNLNGYSLYCSNTEKGIENNGKLEITNEIKINGNETDQGILQSSSKKGIINDLEGNLKIKNVLIEANEGNLQLIYNNGNLLVDGGTIQSDYNLPIYNEQGEITVEKGNIKNNRSRYNNETLSSTIYSSSPKKVIINGGYIYNNCSTYGMGIGINIINGTLEINGGTITNSDPNSKNGYSIKAYRSNLENTGRVIINDGEIEKPFYIYSYDCEINGGNFKGENYYNYNYIVNKYIYANVELNIKGGNFESNGADFRIGVPSKIEGATFKNIQFELSDNMDISNTIIDSPEKIMSLETNKTINISNTNIKGRIYNKNTGTINIKENVQIEDNSTTIYNLKKGTINIGIKDGKIKNNISIKNNKNNYGIDNSENGIVNFYDGEIIGGFVNTNSGEKRGTAINGKINDVEDNAIIEKNVEDEKEIARLAIKNVYKIIETDKKYYTLRDAILACENQNVTIQVLEDNITTSKDEFKVLKNQNIILDLNGKKLGVYQQIVNEGTLKLINSAGVENGKINTLGTIITNKAGANLIVENVKIDGQYNGYQNNNVENVTIKNYGNLEVKGVYLTGTVGIENVENANSKLTGTTINYTGSNPNGYNMLRNSGTGKIEVEESKLVGSIKVLKGEISIKNSTIDNSENTYNNPQIYNSAKMQLEGNTINSDIKNLETGILTIKSGTLQGMIENEGTGTVNVEGGTIEYRYSAIINYSTGTINVIGGILKATQKDRPVIENQKLGTINIGIKDGNINSEEPNIIGKEYGIYNKSTGKINFYDGKVTGAIQKSIYGNIAEIEEAADIVKIINADNTETIKLSNDPIAININTNEKFRKIDKAIEACNNGETIQLLRNLVMLSDQETIVIDNGRSVILDLNGYIISAGKDNMLNNSGNLEIKDSSTEKTGKITSLSGKIFTNEAGAILKISTEVEEQMRSTTMIENKGQIIVEKGTISTTNIGVICIDNKESGIMTLKDSNIIATNKTGYDNKIEGRYVINNMSSERAKLENCNISINSNDKENAIYNSENGIMEITNSVLSGTSIGIYNNGKIALSNTTISGAGRCNGSIIILNEKGKIEINESQINLTDGYAISNRKTGEIKLNQSNIKTKTTMSNYPIYNQGSIKINGGRIEGNRTIENLKDAIMEIAGDAEIIYSTIEAINNEGMLIIGTKDNNVNIEKPLIQSKNVAIRNLKGTLKIYDGIFKGSKDTTILGNVAEIEENYELAKNVNNNSEELTLTENEKEAKIEETNTVYYSLQEAVDNANDGETIKILKDKIYSGDFIVNEGKNIIFDLNGFSMYVDKENAIKNSGKLKIINSSTEKESKIYSSYKNIINNEQSGTLNLENVTITNIEKIEKSSYSVLYNQTALIENNGTVIVNDANIEDKYSKKEIGIYNNLTGNLIVNSGNISCVKTVSTVNTTIKGGTIESIYNTSIDNVNVEGGNINQITQSSKGKINITGGIINSIINSQYGEVNINGNTNITTLKNESGTKAQIKQATIDKIENKGKLKVENATIGSINNGYYLDIINSIVGKENIVAITNDRGTCYIENSTISSNKNAVSNIGDLTIVGGTITSTGDCGIYSSGSGSIILGKDDGIIIGDSPKISGKANGIKKISGTLKIYDGTIIGEQGAITGGVEAVPENYEVKYTKDLTIATLGIIATQDKVVSIGNIYYDSIQSAINSANNEDIIKICSNQSVTETIIIPNDISVTIDMNNCIISHSAETATIENNGILHIINSNETDNLYSKIENTIGTTIINKGTLVIGKNDENVINNIQIVSQETTIQNNGQVEFYDGQLIGKDIIIGTTNIRIPEGYQLITTKNDNNQMVANLQS